LAIGGDLFSQECLGLLNKYFCEEQDWKFDGDAFESVDHFGDISIFIKFIL
jgi:hypothetical protein